MGSQLNLAVCAVTATISASLLSGTAAAQGEASAEELAMQLANPLAALISVPLQLNYDRNIGLDDKGDRWTTNIQPVVPVALNEDWNLISRTILPVVRQDNIFPGAGSQFGLGDVVQSVFFSPVAPQNGWVVGAGPVFLVPTGTDDLLSAEQWGAGPTGVALKQSGPWTYGALANHIWSFAGDDDRGDVNATFLQPFVAYATPTGMSFTLQAENTYDWESEQWTVPLGAIVSQVTRFGDQRMSVGGGLRYYAEGPDSAPEGWALRFFVTLLFPT